MTRTLRLTMAAASGVAVANIYYNQPMLADMAGTLHTSFHQIAFVATLTQIGYAAGMPLFIPLGDLVNRRKLVTTLFVAAALSSVLAAIAHGLVWLCLASFLLGATSVIAQILIPLAAELSMPEEQGRTIGTVLSGVLLGILLARTLSGIVAAHLGWRAMYWLAAGMCLTVAGLLAGRLPNTKPKESISYFSLMHSLLLLVRDVPKLRQVCVVAALFFAAFSAFWTTLVFLLERPPFHMGSQAAGLFGLAGATGALIAPVAGRLSDRRSPRFVVRIAIAVLVLSFVIFWAGSRSIPLLIIGVILLDGGVQAAQVSNQSRVFQLRPEARNRINTVYMIAYFGGGSLGSLIGAWAWARWAWPGVCAAGIVCMVLATAALLVRGPNSGVPDAQTTRYL